MGFTDAIKSGFSNYVNFTGRSLRSAYWYWFLFAIVASIVLAIIDAKLIGSPVLQTLFGLATFLPGIAVGVRRLHDTDRSGWWVFIGLIPLIGIVLLIVWFCAEGTPGANRFGPPAPASA